VVLGMSSSMEFLLLASELRGRRGLLPYIIAQRTEAPRVISRPEIVSYRAPQPCYLVGKCATNVPLVTTATAAGGRGQLLSRAGGRATVLSWGMQWAGLYIVLSFTLFIMYCTCRYTASPLIFYPPGKKKPPNN